MDKPKPYTADTAECQAAVDQFVERLTKGTETTAQAYRNMAHAMGMAKAAFSKLRDAATKANRVLQAEAMLAAAKSAQTEE